MRTDVIWVALGQFTYAACQWGIAAILTRSGGTDRLGQYTLALATTAPLILLAGLHLRTLQATDARGVHSFWTYFSVRTLSTVVVLTVIVGVAVVGDYSLPTRLVIVLVAISKTIEGISDVVFGLLQKHHYMRHIAVSYAARGVLSLVVVAAILRVTDNLVYSMLGMCIVWLILCAFLDARAGLALLPVRTAIIFASRGRNAIWSDMLSLARIGLPMGVTSMLVSYTANIPLYFLAVERGQAVVGAFSAMAYFIVPGRIVVEAVGQAASARLSQLFISDPTGYRRLLIRMLGVAGLIGAATVAMAAVTGGMLLRLAYAVDFGDYHEVFIVLMFSAAVTYLFSIVGLALVAMRSLRFQLPIYVTVALAECVLSWLAVPRYGAMGAASALAGGGSLSLVLLSALLLYEIRSADGAPAATSTCRVTEPSGIVP